MKNQQFKTLAVQTLASIIKEMDIVRFEIDEELTDHRINVRVRPAKVEDYLCMVGSGQKMFHNIRKIIKEIANSNDAKVLTWDEVTKPIGTPAIRYKKLYDHDREESFVRDLAEALFGYRDEVEFKRVDGANVVNIVIGHAESQKEIVASLKEPLDRLLTVIGFIHNMTFNLTLIPSAFEKEKQPTTAAGRYSPEVKP